MQKALPFKNKPKTQAKAGKVPRDRQRPAVIREPHERKVLSTVTYLSLHLVIEIVEVGGTTRGCVAYLVIVHLYLHKE